MISDRGHAGDAALLQLREQPASRARAPDRAQEVARGRLKKSVSLVIPRVHSPPVEIVEG